MPFEIRLLGFGDEALLDTFLKPHTAEAYFLRSNALKGGLVYEGKYLQGEYLAAFDNDKIVAVLAYSWMNTLLVCGDKTALQALTKAMRSYIAARGGKLEAILGLAPEADAVIEALSLPQESFRSNKEDWLFRLGLENLRRPALLEDPALHLRPATEADKAQLIAWRIDFNIEATKATPGPELEAKVTEEIETRIKEGTLFVLEKEGSLLSFCGLAGYVPEARIVGPVWTPPALRGRGFAKAVTAGAIDFLASTNPKVEEIILFASEPDAIRVYTSLGFTQIADWRLALLNESVRVSA